MCLQQGVPSLQPAPSRQLVRNERGRGVRDDMLSIYLHMQSSSGSLFASASISRDVLRKEISMSSGLQSELDRIPSNRFAAVADDARVTQTAAALEANGFSVPRATSVAEAKRIVLGLIPAGSQVYHGASQSLEVPGIVDEIEASGRYEPLR